jgi:hypothetical protein
MTRPELISWWASFSEIDICIVNGKYVRENFDIDFTQGGNHGKYDFIPKNEIWIDNGLNDDEIVPTVLHEMIEYRLMGSGLDYDRAHDVASEIELAYRKLDDYDATLDRIEELAESIVKVNIV